jgi:murein DD-endopeptidase MepM/ murein hydrolase activator NlpD
MPIGTPMLASRSGRVFLVEERFSDGTRIPGQENYINVLHSDGSMAGYVHLTRDGALVEVGDEVVQGQWIAVSGDTGSSTEAHLHFHVQGCDGCPTVPVTFRNARPATGRLLESQSYTADPF